MRVEGAIALGIALAAGSGCKPVPDRPKPAPADMIERGRAAIVKVQCGACHAIPGIDWPQGRLGPPLDRIAGQGLIAGTIPNSPANLARFVRNAPAVKPGTAMPAMPLGEADSRAIAAYLLQESRP